MNPGENKEWECDLTVKHISELSGASDGERLSLGAEFLRRESASVLVLEAKTYYLDSCLDLSGAGNVTLDGGGATLIFNASKGAIALSDGKQVTVKNLTLEPAEDSFIEGRILSADPLGIHLLFPESERERAAGLPCGSRMLIYSRCEERFTGAVTCAALEARDDGSFRCAGDYDITLPSDRVCIPDRTEDAPAVRIADSEGVTLDTVNIFGGGSGVLCLGSTDVLLHRVMVVPAPGRGMSTPGAGAKFADCGGVKLKNCVFEGQGSDALAFSCEKAELSGCTQRNSFGCGVLMSAREAILEGFLFDGSVLSAVSAGIREGDLLEVKNSRIIRRGEKYRFSPEHEAGGICVCGHGGRVTLSQNMIVCPDTGGAVYVSGTDELTVRANEILCIDADKRIWAEDCGTAVTEGNI